MEPQDHESEVTYEDYKSIKDRPPSPFLAASSGGTLEDELDLDGKQHEHKEEKDKEGTGESAGSATDDDDDEDDEEPREETKTPALDRRSSVAVKDSSPGRVPVSPLGSVPVSPANSPTLLGPLPPPSLPLPPTPRSNDSSVHRTDSDSKSLEIAPVVASVTPSPEFQRTRASSVKKEAVTTADVHTILGKDGVRMFNALLGAARKDVGLKKAWQLKADILKCMIKTKVLIDESKIQIEELEPFKEPLNNLGNLFLQLLADKKKYSEESAIKPTLFGTLCQTVGQLWTKLLEPHLDPIDLAKGQTVVEYVSSLKFILTFLSDSEYLEEKKMMKTHARRLLKLKLKPTCARSKCTRSRLMGWSRYCAAHHQARFAKLYEPPNFDAFVRGEETAEFLSFHDFFVEFPVVEAPLPDETKRAVTASPHHNKTISENEFLAVSMLPAPPPAEQNRRLFNLYLDLLRLHACVIVKDRQAVSKQIFEKFLEPGAPSHVNLWRYYHADFPPPRKGAWPVHPLLLPINMAMESGLAAVQPEIFRRLSEFVGNVIKQSFDAFVATPAFKSRLEQFRLPESTLAALDDKQATQESEDRAWEEGVVVRFNPKLEYIPPVNYSLLPT